MLIRNARALKAEPAPKRERRNSQQDADHAANSRPISSTRRRSSTNAA
jgi:hypothetical protein